MATRRIRGILSRNDWQFYESACSIATVQASFSAGQGYLVFTNNSPFGEVCDLFRVEVSTSIGCPMQYIWANRVVGLGGSLGLHQAVFSTHLLPGAPTGQIDAFGTLTFFANFSIRKREDSTQYDVMEMQNGGPFLSLPSGFNLVVLVTTSASCQANFTLWYQVMIDSTVLAN